MTLCTSAKYTLGVFPADTWRADAAREAVAFLGAAKGDTLAVYMSGKTQRISISEHVGGDRK